MGPAGAGFSGGFRCRSFLENVLITGFVVIVGADGGDGTDNVGEGVDKAVGRSIELTSLCKGSCSSDTVGLTSRVDELVDPGNSGKPSLPSVLNGGVGNFAVGATFSGVVVGDADADDNFGTFWITLVSG